MSVRHDRDPQRYLLSRSLAPELVTAADVTEFALDSAAVDSRGRAVYLERFALEAEGAREIGPAGEITVVRA